MTAGATMPPMAATAGSTAWPKVDSSPCSNSRLISRPTRKKKIAIKPSLIQCSSDLSSASVADANADRRVQKAVVEPGQRRVAGEQRHQRRHHQQQSASGLMMEKCQRAFELFSHVVRYRLFVMSVESCKTGCPSLAASTRSRFRRLASSAASLECPLSRWPSSSPANRSPAPLGMSVTRGHGNLEEAVGGRQKRRDILQGWQRRGHDREERPKSACGACDIIAHRDRCAGQPLQLEQVGRGDRSQGDKLIADGLRSLPGDVELSRIAQNRIDADKGSCVGRFDASNRLRRSGHRLRRRKISGEDGIERPPAAVRFERSEHRSNVRRRQVVLRELAEARPACQQNRRQRPDFVPQPLQCRHGGGQADASACYVR